ncbi:ABC transporter ATP-binding protein [Micromonospora sp. NBC_00898]|uniref:ABC transporter ATP-binding protein n=1 Tax=Micromonospora sp. NBC_00898 TaxID=2975981 RepID=UPI00386ADB68|nr:ABC transporter ATP-binding protein [Micromonospora sp. NBC_00898]
MSWAVELREVSKIYPGGVAALSDATLAIADGEMVALLGPSGSGKTTLLQLAGTLDRPTSGLLRVCGHDSSAMSDAELSALRADSIGFVFQQFHLAQRVSALENVAEGLLYAGVRRPRRLALAEQALERVGLGHRLRHAPHELSGGERQRVAIARAIVGQPRLLLADEPTGNLDSVAGAVVLDILHELHGSGTAVVIVTHDHDIARGVPRQIVMRDGRVVGDVSTVEATP